MVAGEDGDLERSSFSTRVEKIPTVSSPLTQESINNERCIIGRRVSTIDTVLVVFSLIAYLADCITDVLVGSQYLHNRQLTWGILTFLWVVLPSIIVQVFSARWYVADQKMHGFRAWAIHIFQLQPFERYVSAIKSGLIARRTGREEDVEDYYYQQNDVCMLRLFEAFLESAPQLTLQLYIMMCTENAHWLTGISAGISLVALGWAVAAYTHALRRAYKQQYRVYLPGLVLQTVWHMAMAAARVAALVAFASVFKAWVFMIVGVHWVLMTTWVILQNTDFCPSRTEEIFFDGVVGLIYCYCFFNLKEGPTRWRMGVYYGLMLAENVLMIGIWYPFRLVEAWYNQLLMSMVFVTFAIGVTCLLLYYRFCHPGGPITCWDKTSSETPPTTPTLTKFTPNSSFQKPHLNKTSGASLLPKHTSTGQLPRRALLKPMPSKANIKYKEVFTPSHLTPIHPVNGAQRIYKTPRRPVYADCTLHLEDTSAFQHYSVDATAFVREKSQCNTLEATGIDLSCGTFLDTKHYDDSAEEHQQGAPIRKRIKLDGNVSENESMLKQPPSGASSDSGIPSEQHSDNAEADHLDTGSGSPIGSESSRGTVHGSIEEINVKETILIRDSSTL